MLHPIPLRQSLNLLSSWVLGLSACVDKLCFNLPAGDSNLGPDACVASAFTTYAHSSPPPSSPLSVFTFSLLPTCSPPWRLVTASLYRAAQNAGAGERQFFPLIIRLLFLIIRAKSNRTLQKDGAETHMELKLQCSSCSNCKWGRAAPCVHFWGLGLSLSLRCLSLSQVLQLAPSLCLWFLPTHSRCAVFTS